MFDECSCLLRRQFLEDEHGASEPVKEVLERYVTAFVVVTE